MPISNTCTQNTDPKKLIREGTSQDQRLSFELDPAYVSIDEHKIEHNMAFAKAYAKYLQFYGSENKVIGSFSDFFSKDVSAQLAIAAVQNVDFYKSSIKECFDFLSDYENKNKDVELKKNLTNLFNMAATLAKQLDRLKEELPVDIHLKTTLQNLIKNHLAPNFKQLIACFKAGKKLNLILDNPGLQDSRVDILGDVIVSFESVFSLGLSTDWRDENNWENYLVNISENTSVYGDPVGSIFDKTNHIATHELFNEIFDQFLKVLSRTTINARAALKASLSERNDHQPHYALFIAFLRLFEYYRTEVNTLTQRHLDLYYREILKLKEKSAEPSQAHLFVTLAKQIEAHQLKTGELFKAGKDALGQDVFFTNDKELIANQAKVTEFKTIYRHKNTKNETLDFQNDRLFASPISNSQDGLGAKLKAFDQSWHPFFNKTYIDGKLFEIDMPKAEIGFALSSHYLMMAEGERSIMLRFSIDSSIEPIAFNTEDLRCLISVKDGWFKVAVTEFAVLSRGELILNVKLDGSVPPTVCYLAKTHGYSFDTNLPVLLFKLEHKEEAEFSYAALQSIDVQEIGLSVKVTGLKTLTISNDFGPIDTSKPFQPLGAAPIANSAFIIGSKEVFQKKLNSIDIQIKWQAVPNPYEKTVKIHFKYLQNGVWQPSGIDAIDIKSESFHLESGLDKPVIDRVDFSSPEAYQTSSRHGFIRLEIQTDFGQENYEQDLTSYIKAEQDRLIANIKAEQSKIIEDILAKQGKLITDTHSTSEQKPAPIEPQKKPVQPIGPFVMALSLDYKTQEQIISLDSTDTEAVSNFYHIAPFGQVKQKNNLDLTKKINLIPQFVVGDTDRPIYSNAEFYIGITDLKPPQNLALLFQVADGTANPLANKASVEWSYLSYDGWKTLTDRQVQDGTDDLLNSGVITFSIPETASATNTLCPSGQHWLKAAVHEDSDAVCRLIAVSAQGLTVTFQDHGNDPAFPAKILPPDTINKLDQPHADIKQINQPSASFGGRASELPTAFYARISERLRHKDRAIALWDYEHLVLEQFPQIYKVKCLNHTFYDSENGISIYKELAPGHVTLITLPDLQAQHTRDPLRPYTNLGLLQDIETFLKKRLSPFIKLHVKNPQFEEVRVELKVQFLQGFDATFYANQLEEALIRFLSPWAFPGGGNPSFGGKIYQSVLINFVEEQTYVDYVTDFKLSHTYTKLDKSGAEVEVVDVDLTEIEGSKAISILVSAKHHSISPINPAEALAIGKSTRAAS